MTVYKHKIINDPVWGFISIAQPLVFRIIEHPYFQRLRRIKQLGLTEMVYPGANHTRFAHALGAFYLMTKSVELLKEKGIEITSKEEEALYCGILLHDIGHGPFSHSLEFTLIKDIHHEHLSLNIMQRLNKEFNGALDLCIEIFLNKYPKKYLHQLISSQLDMDRLDYLSRDSFYTGVSEGVIGAERLVHMLNVAQNELVIEEKGIYSVEKFLIARRLMYWQVYLHKTVVISDCMLQQILKRTAYLLKNNLLQETIPLHAFLADSIVDKEILLSQFLNLDDSDVIQVIKAGQVADDVVLSVLSNQFMQRNLWEINLSSTKFPSKFINEKLVMLAEKYNISAEDAKYLVWTGKLENNAYMQEGENIKILMKNKQVMDVATASDNYNLDALKKKVTKHFVTWSD